MPTVNISYNTGATYVGGRLFSIIESDATTAYWDGGSPAKIKGSSGASNERGIVLFALPGGLGTVTVSAAALTLFKESASDDTDKTLSVNKLVRAGIVYNQATWNSYATASNWGTAGASNTTSDIVSAASDSKVGTNGAGDFVLNAAQIAADVQAAINAGAAYVGWVVTQSDLFTRFFITADGGANGDQPDLAFTYSAGGGGQVSSRNGIALSDISAINGITKSGVSAINGLTI